MELQQAVNEAVLSAYPQYKNQIVVINNTIRLNMAFTNKENALKFIDVLHDCIRQRIDDTFLVFYSYLEGPLCIYDRTRFKGPHISQELMIKTSEGNARSCGDRRIRFIK